MQEKRDLIFTMMIGSGNVNPRKPCSLVSQNQSSYIFRLLMLIISQIFELRTKLIHNLTFLLYFEEYHLPSLEQQEKHHEQ